jgi:hypothetical protein
MTSPDEGPAAHWIYPWIDEFGVSDRPSARVRLNDRVAFDRLHDLASAHQSRNSSSLPFTGTVLAGSGLEIDNRACHSLGCRKYNFDFDFGVLYHYFDYVVMQGPSAAAIARSLERMDDHGCDEGVLRTIAADVELMNYIRSIGMSRYVLFVDKEYPCLCDEHFESQVAEIGLEDLADPTVSKGIIADVLRNDSVYIEQLEPGIWTGKLVDPSISTDVSRVYKLKRRPTKRWVATDLVYQALYTTIRDTAVARDVGAPLASIAQPGFIAHRKSRRNPITPDDVALDLAIPALAGLPTAELLKLREHEYSHFERFRQVLTEAIQATIERSGTDSPAVIADKVWRNEVRPALADIDRRIEASNRAFTKKALLGVSLGAVAATIGTIVGFPLIAAAGVAAAIGTPLPQTQKWFEERQQIELHDMYFLWKAQRIGEHYTNLH